MVLASLIALSSLPGGIPASKPSPVKVHQRHALLGSQRRPVNVAMKIGIAAFANHDILFDLDGGRVGRVENLRGEPENRLVSARAQHPMDNRY